MNNFEGVYFIRKRVRSGYLKNLIIFCLLATFCLNIVGCSNNLSSLREKSKTSKPMEFKRINKAWYKHM